MAFGAWPPTTTITCRKATHWRHRGNEGGSFVEAVYLGAAGGRPHAGACSLHQSPLVSRQQVVLHGLNQVIFTCATVLNQGLFLHPLTQSDRKTPSCF